MFDINEYVLRKAVWLDSGGGAVRHAQAIELRLGCTNEFM